MRLYTQEDLQDCSRINLMRKLDMVKSSIDLTREEVEKNVAEIEFALNGGVRHPNADAIRGIKAGEADTSDMEGH